MKYSVFAFSILIKINRRMIGMSKFCYKCGAQLDDADMFCNNCGTKQEETVQAQPSRDYQNAQNYTGGSLVMSKSIGVCIILSIITCGIYSLYWLYCMAEDLNRISGKNDTSGGLVVLLSIITCGIYGWFWLYQAGDKINQGKMQRGVPADSSLGILYLVLGIFSLSIISYALIQNEINKFAVN